MKEVFERWGCIFPGKLGLAWKRAWPFMGTKEEAEAEASKNCNVVAVPEQLLLHIESLQIRLARAEIFIKQICVETAKFNS